MAAIQAGVGEYAQQDPNAPDMMEARKATFAGMWPHEGKKGWKCKTKQVRLGSGPIGSFPVLTLAARGLWMEIHTYCRIRRHGNVRLLRVGTRWMGAR